MSETRPDMPLWWGSDGRTLDCPRAKPQGHLLKDVDVRLGGPTSGPCVDALQLLCGLLVLGVLPGDNRVGILSKGVRPFSSVRRGFETAQAGEEA